MKTTLEIPDELFRRTKAEAALTGQSMKQLVIDALDEKLRKKKRTSDVVGWRKVFGRATRAMTREVSPREQREGGAAFEGRRRRTQPAFHRHERLLRTAQRTPHDQAA